MNITLNGSVFIGGEEIYFEDFTIESEEELDLPFDFLTDDEEDYCHGYCEDCDFCDDEEEFLLDPLEKLVEEYTELLSDECICPDCISGILTSFVYELISDEE